MKVVFVSGGNGKEDAPSQGGCGGNGKDPTIVYYDATYKTNADIIRAMTDEELADWLGVYCNGQTAQEVGKPCVSDMGSCEECWLDWLKRESEDEW